MKKMMIIYRFDMEQLNNLELYALAVAAVTMVGLLEAKHKTGPDVDLFKSAADKMSKYLRDV